MMAEDVLTSGGDGFSVIPQAMIDTRNRIGDAIDQLDKAKTRLTDAEQAPQQTTFGSSPEARLVIQYWIEAVAARIKETQKCIEWCNGLYAMVQLGGDRYFEQDQDSAAQVKAVSVEDLDRYFRTYAKPPAQIQLDHDDHGGMVRLELAQIEGSGESGNDNEGTGMEGAEGGGEED